MDEERQHTDYGNNMLNIPNNVDQRTTKTERIALPLTHTFNDGITLIISQMPEMKDCIIIEWHEKGQKLTNPAIQKMTIQQAYANFKKLIETREKIQRIYGTIHSKNNNKQSHTAGVQA